MSVQYFGPNGHELAMLEWAALVERRSEDMSNDSWWRRRTEISEGVEVSTVWLGINHAFLRDEAPLFWETMIFGGEHTEYCWRYSSRQQALDDHERIVRALRAGEAPAEVALGDCG